MRINGAYTDEDLDAAASVWEAVLEFILKDKRDGGQSVWSREREAEGTAAYRMKACEFAVKLQHAWELLGGAPVYDAPFDWEFVPNVLRALGTLDAPDELIISAAQVEFNRMAMDMEAGARAFTATVQHTAEEEN